MSILNTDINFHMHNDIPTIRIQRNAHDGIHWIKIAIRSSKDAKFECNFFGTSEQLDELEVVFNTATVVREDGV